jgi:hypothetical protein
MAAMDGAAAIESQGLEVRRLKASGLGNKDAPVVAAVAELQRLKALMPSSSSTEIKQDEATGDRDFAAFMEVQKHRSSCIHWLLTFAQRIELSWYVGLPRFVGSAGGCSECQLAPSDPHAADSAAPRFCVLTGMWTARLVWLRS